MLKTVLKWAAVVVICFFGVIVAAAIFDPQPAPAPVEATVPTVAQTVSTSTSETLVVAEATPTSATVENKAATHAAPATASSPSINTTSPSPSPKPPSVTNTVTASSDTKTGPADLYPDPALTPGDAFSVDVATLCTSGYTATVRDVSTATRQKVYAEYGVSYPQPSGAYEVDHFIPLEIGGSNDIKNLWLEPASPTPGFHQKDQFENYEHAQICNGTLTIQEAQTRMTTDWYMYWLQETNTAPSTQTQSSAVTSGHTFYLSTYYSATYYYCDTDTAWKGLSTKYLKSYSSEAALLADYPSRTLHAACQ